MFVRVAQMDVAKQQLKEMLHMLELSDITKPNIGLHTAQTPSPKMLEHV